MSRGEFVFRFLSNFWQNFKEKEAFSLFWDAKVRQTANLFLQAFNVDRSKGLFTVPALYRTEWYTFRFDDTTQTSVPATAPTGYAFAYSIDSGIAIIENMQRNVDPTGEITEPGLVLVDDVDYIVLPQDSVILFALQPPQFMHSNTVFRDEMAIYNNFGILVEYQNSSTYEDTIYLSQVQGLWTALWLGGSLSNIELGIHILLGFPFMGPGTVVDVQPNPDGSYLVVVNDSLGDGRRLEVPARLSPPLVTAGQVVTRFTPLGQGVTVTDYVDDFDFMIGLVASGSLELAQIFFTFSVFLSQDAFAEARDSLGLDALDIVVLPLIESFLDKIKPTYTDYKYTPDIVFDPESFEFDDGTAEDFNRFIFRDLTSTVLDNYSNVLQSESFNLDEEAIAFTDFLEIQVIDGTSIDIYNV